MLTRYLECGANLPEGSRCQLIFESLLVLEYSNSEYGQVHLLTLAGYGFRIILKSSTKQVWLSFIHDPIEVILHLYALPE